MSSTLKRTSRSRVLDEWNMIFHRQAAETYIGSVTFLKQLTTVAFSTIIYVRDLFPEENYTKAKFAGLPLTILKANCEDEMAQFLISSLNQAFEAFDKKYLHKLAICFYKNECSPENLLEYYLFEYSYCGKDGPTVSVHSSKCEGSEEPVSQSVTFDNVRERTVQLLKACVTMTTSHMRLPEGYDVSLRLYYNDSAPEGYQPPGFTAVTGPDGISGGFKLGSVGTRFHRLQMWSHCRDISHTESESAELSRQQLEKRQPEEQALPAERDVHSPSARSVRCECGLDDREPEAMLTCRYCGSLQHAVCYGVKGASSREHCCVSCADSDPRRSSDAGLTRAGNRKCYTIFRRGLWWLAGAGGAGARRVVSVAGLGAAIGLQPLSARKLMHLLRKQGALKQDLPTDPERPVEVVRRQVEELMSNYFCPPSSEDDVDSVATRLLEECRSSQRSDLLTEVLSPMERVSLQATANTAKVVQTPPEDSQVANAQYQDSALEQYRSALAPLDTNESPRAAILKTPRKRAQAGDRKAGGRAKRARKPSLII